jgi:hypothetical protein
MAVKLSRASYEHAQRLIKDGKFVLDERNDWSEHQPSTPEENRSKNTGSPNIGNGI